MPVTSITNRAYSAAGKIGCKNDFGEYTSFEDYYLQP